MTLITLSKKNNNNNNNNKSLKSSKKKMGFNKFFKKLEENAEKLVKGDTDAATLGDDWIGEEVSQDYQATLDNTINPTRWEKAVVGLGGIVKQVSKVDPDGLDIVCFGGCTEEEDADETNVKSSISVYPGVKSAKDIETMVKSKLPGGPCNMGKAMDFVLKRAFDKGFKDRPCGVLVLTAGQPENPKRLEKTIKHAAEKIAQKGYKESPLNITFVQIGDDEDASKFLHHVSENLTSETKSKKTRKVVDIVDTIKDSDIKAAMKEIKGTKSSGKNGAIIGAFAGAAMGVGGMYLYNKNQAKKRTAGWNGRWKVTYMADEICTLNVKDDRKGRLTITGFDGGQTTGSYIESKHGYNITYREPGVNWKITGDIEDEHTIFWSDGSRWDEIPPGGGKWTHYAGAVAAGAATGGAVGYLLDKKFFQKASKKDQCDYVIMVDRSAKMAVKDRNQFLVGDDNDTDEDYDMIQEYKPEPKQSATASGNLADKFHNLSTGQKVAVGVAGATAVAGVTAAGVGIANAVKTSKEDDRIPVATARSTGSAGVSTIRGGFNGRWRSTFEGDELAVLTVTDELDGILTIDGFPGGRTIGKYSRSSLGGIQKINFIDAEENWPVTGAVKGGPSENVILWSDETRWDKIA
jgi:hypothetical protein